MAKIFLLVVSDLFCRNVDHERGVDRKMKRDLDKLADVHFDIVIIGSGIHGAVLALEAVRNGYSVALLDKGDFGHSTSANSLKIIHGRKSIR